MIRFVCVQSLGCASQALTSMQLSSPSFLSKVTTKSVLLLGFFVFFMFTHFFFFSLELAHYILLNMIMKNLFIRERSCILGARFSLKMFLTRVFCFSKMHEHRYFYLECTTNGHNYYQMNKTT